MTIPQSSSSHIEHSQAMMQTPASAASASASAAASASASTAAGSAAQVPQVPMHALGPQNVARPPYQTALPVYELGIVSSYLEQQDQLEMRDINAAVCSVVDRTVTSLTLSAPEAEALFSAPNALHNLRELRLTDCNDADLFLVGIALAQVHMPILGRLELILDNDDGNLVTAHGLARLAPFDLAGISLNGMTVTAAEAHALSLGRSPVSIVLPDDELAISDVPAICRIPTLKRLHAPLHRLSRETVAALREHHSLTQLSVGTLNGAAVCELAASGSIQMLSVRKITGGEANVFAAIARNTVLRSVFIGQVDDARSLMTLSSNPLLTSVALRLSTSAINGIASLANMPSLQSLSLSAWQASGTLRLADVQALCARSFTAFQLEQWEIDPAAMAHIVATNARHLSLDGCYPFNGVAIDGLSSNRSLVSLSLLGGVINAHNAITLATSPTLRYLRTELSNDAPGDAEEAIENAWASTDKPLANLDIRRFEQDGDNPDNPDEDA